MYLTQSPYMCIEYIKFYTLPLGDQNFYVSMVYTLVMNVYIMLSLCMSSREVLNICVCAYQKNFCHAYTCKCAINGYM